MTKTFCDICGGELTTAYGYLATSTSGYDSSTELWSYTTKDLL